GKLYIENTEHNPRDPQPRGAPFICLDLETGEEIFRIAIRGSEWGSSPMMADSTIVMYNEYNQLIYAIGKGPSAITVDVSPEIQAQGSSVMITGTVTDVSPGTEDAAIKMRFPQGVPVVADESMSDWMLYVYNQFERPTDVTGAEVTLIVQDPNGDYYQTTTTCDANGVYNHMWTPAIVGEYQVTAVYEGSESYYASQMTTAFGIDSAPAPSTSIEPETPVDTETPADTEEPAAFLTTEVAIIAAVAVAAVIGVSAYWILKRK
ncbi:MAG: hypothetical protein ACOWW1_10765, partial [archaeon]